MSSSKPDILLAVPLPDDLRSRLAEDFAVTVAPSGYFPPDAEFDALVTRSQGVILTAYNRIDADLLAKAPGLRAISACSVGLDNIDMAAASRHGVVVCNTPGTQDRTVAEMAIALVMALGRRLFDNDAFVRSGDWQKRQVGLAGDIAGKRLGLLGMGGIGRNVARIGVALGMDVTYHKRGRDGDAEAAGLARYVDRDTLFRESDFVSLHLPLTADTAGSVGAADLALMKRTGFLVNTARGAIVDEDALVAALTEGRIAGAGLDVMAKEPLPQDSALLRAPNVILQPHAGGATAETRRRMEALAVANLVEALAGRRPAASPNWDSVRGAKGA